MSRFIKALVVCSLVSSAAFADTTGEIDLSGNVASTLSITATATASAGSLDLSAGQKIVKVGDLAMTTNNSAGLKMTASSGALQNPDLATPIDFQVTSVADGGSAPASGAFVVASGQDYEVSSSAAGAFNKDLYIMYTPASVQDPGTYTAIINLSVEDL